MWNLLQDELGGGVWPRLLVALLDTGVKGLFLMAAAGLAAVALRRKAAAARHLVWMLALGGLLLLPVVSLMMPKWTLPILPATEAPAVAPIAATPPIATAPAAPAVVSMPIAEIAPAVTNVIPPTARSERPPAPIGATPPESAQAPMNYGAWLLATWLAFALLSLAPFAAGIVAVARMRRRAQAFSEGGLQALASALGRCIGLKRPARLLRGPAGSMPMATGFIKPAVFLPDDALAWTEEKRRVVLLHELAHVKRRDCLTHAIARTATALHWFNPLAWMALRQLRIEREHACDDLVLAAGERPSAYAENLLEIARTLRASTVVSAAAITMAQKSQLEGRLLAVLDAARNRGLVTRKFAVICIATVGMVVGVLGAVAVTRDTAATGNLLAIAKPVKKTSLESFFGGWRNLPFKLSDGDTEAIAQCLELSQRYNAIHNGVNSFSLPDVRESLEALLSKHPDFFYAEHFLGTWHQMNGNTALAEDYFLRSYRHAPVVLIQRYEHADGSPITDAAIRQFEIECNRVQGGSLDPSLNLKYFALTTDSEGCVYLPVYDTVYRADAMSFPEGFDVSYPKLGWFESRGKVAMLPVAEVRTEESTIQAVVWTGMVDLSLASALPDGMEEIEQSNSPYVLYRGSREDFWRVWKRNASLANVLAVEPECQWLGESHEIGHDFFLNDAVQFPVEESLERIAHFSVSQTYHWEPDGDHANLSFSGSASANLAHMGVRAAEAPDATVSGELAFDGTLKAGELLVYMAPMGRHLEFTPMHLIVVEAVSVPTKDAAYVRAMSDTRLWLSAGMPGLLQEVEAASAWEQLAPTTQTDGPAQQTTWTSAGDVNIDPKGHHTLPLLNIVAVGRPMDWPHCWWDLAGHPVRGNPAWQDSLAGENALAIVYTLDSTQSVDFTLRGANMETGGLGGRWSSDYNDNERLLYVSDRDFANYVSTGGTVNLVARTGVGPWSEIGVIHAGETLELDGGTFRIDEVKPERARQSRLFRRDLPGKVSVRGRYDFDPEWEIVVVGVDSAGHRSPVIFEFGSGLSARRENRLLAQHVEMAYEEIDHLILLKRPVAHYVVSNIPTRPGAPFEANLPTKRVDADFLPNQFAPLPRGQAEDVTERDTADTGQTSTIQGLLKPGKDATPGMTRLALVLEGLMRNPPEDTVWGPVHAGLQAALKLLPEKSAYAMGEKIGVEYLVRNSSDRPVEFVTTIVRLEDHGTVVDASGEELSMASYAGGGSGLVDSHRIRLEPGQCVGLRAAPIMFLPEGSKEEIQHPVTAWRLAKDGPISLQFEIRLPDHWPTNGPSAQRPGDWTGTLTTEKRTINIAETTVEESADAGKERSTNAEDLVDERTVWGEVHNGLQAAIYLEPRDGGYAIGDPIDVTILLRNAGTETINCRTSGFLVPDAIIVHDSTGNVRSTGNFKLTDISSNLLRSEIAPGQVIEMKQYSAITFVDGPIDKLFPWTAIAVEPGVHTIQIQTRISPKELLGASSTSLDEYWVGPLTTGNTEILIAPGVPPRGLQARWVALDTDLGIRTLVPWRAGSRPESEPTELSLHEEVLWSDADLAALEVVKGPVPEEFALQFQLTSEAGTRWEKATETSIGKRFALVLNGEVIHAPTLNGSISGGMMTLTGSFDRAEADSLANAIRAANHEIANELKVSSDDTAALGPEIEVTVRHAGENCMIDFDTGKRFTPPDFNGTKDAFAWMAKNSIDAGGGNQDEVRGLIGMDLVLNPEVNAVWDDAAANGALSHDAFKFGTPGNPVYLSAKGELPATWTFKTREGGRGIVQILGFDDDEPRGVKIRYRMME